MLQPPSKIQFGTEMKSVWIKKEEHLSQAEEYVMVPTTYHQATSHRVACCKATRNQVVDNRQ